MFSNMPPQFYNIKTHITNKYAAVGQIVQLPWLFHVLGFSEMVKESHMKR